MKIEAIVWVITILFNIKAGPSNWHSHTDLIMAYNFELHSSSVIQHFCKKNCVGSFGCIEDSSVVLWSGFASEFPWLLLWRNDFDETFNFCKIFFVKPNMGGASCVEIKMELNWEERKRHLALKAVFTFAVELRYFMFFVSVLWQLPLNNHGSEQGRSDNRQHDAGRNI